MASTGEKRTHDAAFAGQDGAAQQAAQPEAQAEAQQPQINPITGQPLSRRYFQLLEERRRLPAWQAKQEFFQIVGVNQACVITGEAGSGKTTQLPYFLLEAGYHVQNGQPRSIMVVEPYRVAAMTAAQRVADELDVPLGTFVGYHVRFEEAVAAETTLKYVTDHILLRQVMSDPLLTRCSVVILDEVHERTLETDILFGTMKEVLRLRSDLRLVLMSSKVDAHQKLQTYFDGAPLLRLPYRSNHVEVQYISEPEKDYLDCVLRTILYIHWEEPEGDVLAFVTSEEEVERICRSLKKEISRTQDIIAIKGELFVVPLFTTLPLAQQLAAFQAAPPSKRPGGPRARKIVVATHLAETSVTINGIIYVVDPGVTRQKVYNPRIRVESSVVVPVSKSVATQRASRAGLTQQGKCYRLYSESYFKTDLPDQVYPEVLRANICTVVLTLKKLGLDDLVHFDFVDPPAPEALMRALETLAHLGCLSENGELTTIGDQVSEFSLEPQLARMLVASPVHRCSNEILSITAMLSVANVFVNPKDQRKAAREAKNRFAHLDGDHLTLLNVFHAFKQHKQDGVDPEKFCYDNFINIRALLAAEIIREQLKATMDRLGLKMISTDFNDKEYYPNIRRCLISGFFIQVAHLEKTGQYTTVKDCQAVALHPSTCLQQKPEWVTYFEVVVSSKTFIRTVTQLRGEWLVDIAPQFYNTKIFTKPEAHAHLQRIESRRPVPMGPNPMAASSNPASQRSPAQGAMPL